MLYDLADTVTNLNCRKLMKKLLAAFALTTMTALVNAHAQQVDESRTYKLSTRYDGIDMSLDATERTAALTKTDRVWQLAPLANGYYLLVTKLKDAVMCLDVYNDTFAAHLGQCLNYTGQIWQLHSTQEGIKLTTMFKGPDFCLDVNVALLAHLVPCEKSKRLWVLKDSAEPAQKTSLVVPPIVVPPIVEPEPILPIAVPPAVALKLPPNGILHAKKGNSGVARLGVETPPDTHFMIKLVNKDTKKKEITIFVRGGSKFETKVPLGTYRIVGVSGTTWLGEKDYFGDESQFFKVRMKDGQEEIPFYIDKARNVIVGKIFTFYNVADGNMTRAHINRAEFEDN